MIEDIKYTEFQQRVCNKSLKYLTNMKSYLLIVILHTTFIIQCASILPGLKIESQQVQELEKEKSAIYNQLNDAVADTILTLEKSNDSDAKQGITYMHELLALVDSLNGTALAPHATCNGSTECTNETLLQTTNDSNLSKDGRRQALPKKVKLRSGNRGYDHIKYAIMNSGIFKSEDELAKAKELKLLKMAKLQKKLADWLKLREAEKERIKQNRARQYGNRHDTVTEECPRHGESKKKKKKGDSGSKKYPCCRKCCKKSYMGCL